MKEVKRNLEIRIKKLERELQEELPEALKRALELGDLRENAEYQTAKERQSSTHPGAGTCRYVPDYLETGLLARPLKESIRRLIEAGWAIP